MSLKIWPTKFDILERNFSFPNCVSLENMETNLILITEKMGELSLLRLDCGRDKITSKGFMVDSDVGGRTFLPIEFCTNVVLGHLCFQDYIYLVEVGF